MGQKPRLKGQCEGVWDYFESCPYSIPLQNVVSFPKKKWCCGSCSQHRAFEALLSIEKPGDGSLKEGTTTSEIISATLLLRKPSAVPPTRPPHPIHHSDTRLFSYCRLESLYQKLLLLTRYFTHPTPPRMIQLHLKSELRESGYVLRSYPLANRSRKPAS
jgi:hypothetical protein